MWPMANGRCNPSIWNLDTRSCGNAAIRTYHQFHIVAHENVICGPLDEVEQSFAMCLPLRASSLLGAFSKLATLQHQDI